jgi:hypothetical protein
MRKMNAENMREVEILIKEKLKLEKEGKTIKIRIAQMINQ